MSEKLTKKYCVEIERDSEEPFNHFFEWSGVPTREDVLKIVMGLDIKYKDEYGRLTFYEIFPEKSVPVPKVSGEDKKFTEEELWLIDFLRRRL